MSLYHCLHCNLMKPIEDFYSYSKSKCKACFNAYNDKWRREHPKAAKVIAHRGWGKRRDKMLARHRSKPRKIKRAPNYLEKFKAYREAHKLEWNVKARVRYAILTGRLVRPDKCSHCGYACKPQAHHEDYSKPFDVIWLCVSCHRRLHNGTLSTFDQANFSERLK